MIDDSFDNDADLWLNLKSRLQHGERESQRIPIRWSFPVALAAGREPEAARWFQHDIRHRQQVSQILDRWLLHGVVDDASEQLRWMFAVRFEPAIDLVSRLTYSKGNLTPDAIWTTFFPFPKLVPEEVLRLLLGDWWCYQGASLFFDAYFDTLSSATSHT